jgi:hypothetical protein
MSFRNVRWSYMAVVSSFAASLIAAPAAAQMTVQSFDVAPTTSEINSFRSYVQSTAPGTIGNTSGSNEWAQHGSSQRTKAMGLVYQFTRDQAILDRMIQYCDTLLSARNDKAAPPVGGYRMWTGNIEPAWPNNTVEPVTTGGEQGDAIGHLAYCARSILQTPGIWNTNVRVGDPKGYGATYLNRAKKFVAEANYSLDQHVFPDLLDLSNQNRMYWRSNPYMSGTVPWNQQVMFTYAFQNLAMAHAILGDDPARVTRYDGIVRACMDWFKSGEAGTAVAYTNGKGRTSYKWSYRPPSGMEDWSHSNLDVQGFYRAYESGRYGVSSTLMTNLANTFLDVIRRGPNDYAGRVDGTDGSGNSAPTNYIRPGWLVAALFRTGDYALIMQEDLTVGGSTGDVTRFSYFLWVKYKRFGSPAPTPTTPPVATAPPGTVLNGRYRLMARHSGKAAAVSGASVTDGAAVVQWTYGGSSTNDEWDLADVGGGYVRILNANSGKAMAVQGASTANGGAVIQWAYGGASANDEWSLIDAGGGYYRIANRLSGKVLDVPGSATADGTALNQWTWASALNQQWQILAVGAATATPTRTATATATARTRATATATSRPRATPTSGGTTTWTANTAYSVGAIVTYGGGSYRCLQAHTSLVGWEPPNAPALWALQ